MKKECIRTSEAIQARARDFRKQMTPAEKALWQQLRGRKLGGYKFRRQHPVGPFIADFYCAQSRLIVELDGDVHRDRKDRDNARDALLESWGYHVIRFWNSEVEARIEKVLERILVACHEYERQKDVQAGERGDS